MKNKSNNYSFLKTKFTINEIKKTVTIDLYS